MSAVTSFQEEPSGHSLWQPGSHRPCYQEVLASAARKAPGPFHLQAAHRWSGERAQACPLPKRASASQMPGAVPKCPGGQSPAHEEGADQKLPETDRGPVRTTCAWMRPRAHARSPTAAPLQSPSPSAPGAAGRAGSLTRGVREGPALASPGWEVAHRTSPHLARTPPLRPCPCLRLAGPPPGHMLTDGPDANTAPGVSNDVLARIKQGGKSPEKVLRREGSSGRGSLGAAGITRARSLPHAPDRLWPGGLVGCRPGDPEGPGSGRCRGPAP